MTTQELTKLVNEYPAEQKYLMPMLHKINDTAGYISQEAMQEIANYLNITPTEIYGVASFYHFFNLQKKGDYVIRLCKSISCDLTKKDAVAKSLENALGISFGETTYDGKFTLEWTNCMGMCDKGPAMLINKEVYTHVTPEKVKEILHRLKKGE